MKKINQTPNAALLVIGNEVLSGRTRDANIQFLAIELQKIGISLTEVRVIRDIENDIIHGIKTLSKKYTYLFTTGGIGPTHDDITSLSVSRAFGLKHGIQPEAETILRNHYKDSVVTPARMKMAEMPIGSELLYNPVSGAPGFRIENVYVMPGVPRIMQAIFDGFKCNLNGGEILLSETVSTNLGEGLIGGELKEIQSKFPSVEIGSYPFMRDGRMGTSLVARHSDRKMIRSVLIEVKALIENFEGEVL